MTLAVPGSNSLCHTLVDTHCHLDASPFADCLEQTLQNAVNAGVRSYVVPGVSPESWACIEQLAVSHDSVYPAYGLHPLCAGRWSAELCERLKGKLSKAVAVGEIGLDYQCQEPREVQSEAFRGQLKLAVAAGLPVLIHCRRAFRDLLTILEEEHVSQVGGVMHAFSGSPEVAEACIRLGLLISVAGPVTWLNAVKPVRVVETIPLSHLVLETDAPDMSPEPYRGRCNEPALLPCMARAVAGIKGVAYSEVAAVTSENARRLLQF